MSVGAQNMVCVSVGAGAEPLVSGGRTATSTGSGTVENFRGFGDLLCAPQQFSMPEAAAADLIAHAVEDMLAAVGAVAEHTVLAHPAVYRCSQLASLRQALDRCGLDAVDLVTEPLACAAALNHRVDREDPDAAANPGPVLVYDLGATSLDLAVVIDDETGHRIAGTPVRSYRFGGRCTAAAVAAAIHDHGHDIEPGSGTADSRLAGNVRAALVRDSAPLIDECLRAAGLPAEQLGAVLLVGGAATPAEVAHALADLLRCPIVRGNMPAHSIALGAAVLGAARPAPDIVMAPLRRAAPRIALALATIAAPVFASAGAGFVSLDIGEREPGLAHTGEHPSPTLFEGSVRGTPEPTPVIHQTATHNSVPASLSRASTEPWTAVPAMNWPFDPPPATGNHVPLEPRPRPATLERFDPPTTPSDGHSTAAVLAESTDFPVIAVHYPEPEDHRGRQHHDDPRQLPEAPPDPTPSQPADSPTNPPTGSAPSEPVDNTPPPATTPGDPTSNPSNADTPAAATTSDGAAIASG
ncbi:Hsp70 family protein [Nocardia sp. NPDC060259]|uniref:Hsp70 family protein n=1 Tax=Nocardia sp. NPDC060259 TaxID=3347088 RepID=UPI00366467A4